MEETILPRTFMHPNNSRGIFSVNCIHGLVIILLNLFKSRVQEVKTKSLKLSTVDQNSPETQPLLIAIVGPSQVGKSLLMKNLIRYYTRQIFDSTNDPITVVTHKNRTLTFYECDNAINSMIETVKKADLVLLMIDASRGFEKETYQFLDACQAHNNFRYPKIIGVYSYMDSTPLNMGFKKIKEELRYRFRAEFDRETKLFYLTGFFYGNYHKQEICNIARFISGIKLSNSSLIYSKSFNDSDECDVKKSYLINLYYLCFNFF